MKALKFINNYQFILFPKFYTKKDIDGNEFVFLKINEIDESILNHVEDKTQLEAYENHVHLFGRVKRKNQQNVLNIAKLITTNLIKELKINFPDKKFHIYLDCDFSDHVIIRFHQDWKEESPYYDTNEFSTIEEFIIG